MFAPVRAQRAGLSATAETADKAAADKSAADKSASVNGRTLTPEQQQQVAELRRRDAEVRQHESAHQAAGGAHAGGASFEYQRGPDGKNYAVGGEVQVDVSRASTPEATIAKMEQVKAAALAPAEPSSQDQRVASLADAIKSQAQQEQRKEENQSGTGGTETANSSDQSAGAQPAADTTGAGSSAGRRATGAYAAAASIGRGATGSLFAVSA